MRMEKTKITYRNWKIEVDKELTTAAYSRLRFSSSEGCDCIYCTNYHKNKEIVFPPEIENLFDKLGIDKTKEPEISHMTKLESGLHLYSGWFHFKGKFEGKDCSIPLLNGNGTTLHLEEITSRFRIGFTKTVHNTIFDDKNELVQIEFDCQIPWVIDKKSNLTH